MSILSIVPANQTNRILLADPHDAALRFSMAIAEKYDCTIVPAVDGREAYRILHSDADFIGVIFSLVMPRLDAPAIIRFMKTEKRLMRIPAMVLTDLESFQLVAEALRTGACAVIPKPYTSTQFAAMLGLLISQKHRLYNQRTTRFPLLKAAG